MSSFLIDDYMMREGLGLTGCELVLFAIIASFSKKGLTMFESEESLAGRLTYSRKQIGRSLQSLLSKGYILRSERKHPGLQSYDYSVNEDRLRQIIPAWCDKTSLQTETKCPGKMRNNVSSSEDKKSHNNRITDNQIENIEDKPHAPFNYILLNLRWEVLLRQPMWVDKTPDQLRIAIERIGSTKPAVGMEMMNYTISRGYRDIYQPGKHILEDGLAATPKFHDDEKKEREKRMKHMLKKIADLAPSDLVPYLPGIKQCKIADKHLTLTCPIAVQQWIENNLDKTAPIIRSAFPGFALNYISPTENLKSDTDSPAQSLRASTGCPLPESRTLATGPLNQRA